MLSCPPSPSLTSCPMLLLLQIAERNKLTHLLPFKTLEEAEAAYQFGCLQVSARRRLSLLTAQQAMPDFIPLVYRPSPIR